jgi:hypothetical protein
MDIIFSYTIASFFAFGFDGLNFLYMNKMKNLIFNISYLFFINLMIIINFKLLKNIIFNKINIFNKYILGCQSFYLFISSKIIFQSFKNLFFKFIKWEILLEKNIFSLLEELGNESNFNLDSFLVSFASTSTSHSPTITPTLSITPSHSPSIINSNSTSTSTSTSNTTTIITSTKQEQISNKEVNLLESDNGYDNEEKEENYIPNKFIDKEKNSENKTQLPVPSGGEENKTRENNKTDAVAEDISNNNSVEIEEGFMGKLRRNFGFDNLSSLWNKNNNTSISHSNLNNNENSISSPPDTNINNNNSKGRFYIDEDNESDFGDFDDF